jgi:hypothetical protein
MIILVKSRFCPFTVSCCGEACPQPVEHFLKHNRRFKKLRNWLRFPRVLNAGGAGQGLEKQYNLHFFLTNAHHVDKFFWLKK